MEKWVMYARGPSRASRVCRFDSWDHVMYIYTQTILDGYERIDVKTNEGVTVMKHAWSGFDDY